MKRQFCFLEYELSQTAMVHCTPLECNSWQYVQHVLLHICSNNLVCSKFAAT